MIARPARAMLVLSLLSLLATGSPALADAIDDYIQHR
jgi:hypothetical protein